MAGKKKSAFDVYAIANEPGTKTLRAFLASGPEENELDSLLQDYSREGRADAMTLVLAYPTPGDRGRPSARWQHDRRRRRLRAPVRGAPSAIVVPLPIRMTHPRTRRRSATLERVICGV